MPPTIPCTALLFAGFTPHWHWFVVVGLVVVVVVDEVVVLVVAVAAVVVDVVVVVVVVLYVDVEHLALECQSQALRAWFHRSPAGQVCSWGVP